MMCLPSALLFLDISQWFQAHRRPTWQGLSQQWLGEVLGSGYARGCSAISGKGKALGNLSTKRIPGLLKLPPALQLPTFPFHLHIRNHRQKGRARGSTLLAQCQTAYPEQRLGQNPSLQMKSHEAYKDPVQLSWALPYKAQTNRWWWPKENPAAQAPGFIPMDFCTPLKRKWPQGYFLPPQRSLSWASFSALLSRFAMATRKLRITSVKHMG